MRIYDYLNGILGAMGAGADNGVPTPSWVIEDYLKAIYDAIKASDAIPEYPDTDGTYVLTVTVASGTPTLSWESAS